MRQPTVREALQELEHDVNGLALAPASAVRARGRTRRLRQYAGATVAATAVLGVAATAAYTPAQSVGGTPSPTSTCQSPPVRVDMTGTLTVFLNASATAQEIAAINTRLTELPGINAFRFRDRQEAWADFARIYCDAPELIAATKPESLPESFQAQLRADADYSLIKSILSAMPGVDTIVRH